MTRVAIVKGEDRFANVLQALELAGDELKRKVGGSLDLRQIELVGTPLPQACFPLKPASRVEILKMWR